MPPRWWDLRLMRRTGMVGVVTNEHTPGSPSKRPLPVHPVAGASYFETGPKPRARTVEQNHDCYGFHIPELAWGQVSIAWTGSRRGWFPTPPGRPGAHGRRSRQHAARPAADR
jgi:hypothetical protein